MANPRVKRAFAGSASDPAQRHITSFFARDETTHGARSCRSPSHEGPSPSLPPSVQANLLAVGMRVRKSVPEGYKTGKDKDTEEHVPQPRSSSRVSSRVPPQSSGWQSASRPAAPQPRELLPFCGLNKVGGLGVQSYGASAGRPMFASSLFEGVDSDAAGDVGDVDLGDAGDSGPPSLTSSQETVSSTSSYLSAPLPRRASTKKRIFGDDDDDDDDSDSGSGSDDSHAMSRPRPAASASVSSWLADGQASPHAQTSFYQLGRRVLAVPRRRQQRQQQQQQKQYSSLASLPQVAAASPKLANGQPPQAGSGVRVFDQENAADFDEADFLDASIMDDMEMGGM